MKIISNPFDQLRIQYIEELAEQLTGKSLALRLSAMAGDIDALDASFDAIRAIGKAIVETRREIKTVDDDEKSEAA